MGENSENGGLKKHGGWGRKRNNGGENSKLVCVLILGGCRFSVIGLAKEVAGDGAGFLDHPQSRPVLKSVPHPLRDPQLSRDVVVSGIPGAQCAEGQRED